LSARKHSALSTAPPPDHPPYRVRARGPHTRPHGRALGRQARARTKRKISSGAAHCAERHNPLMHTRGLHTLRRCLESALRARKSRGLHTPTRPWRVGARPAELRTPATPPTRTRHTSRARLRPSDCKGERARSALCRLILPPWIDGRGRRQRVPVRAAARVRGDSAGVRSPARAQARRARQALRLSRAPPLELLRRARKHRCVLRRLPARPSRARSPLRCRSALRSLS
jgi:hypothetical protein